MKRARRNRGVTTVEWVIVAMIIGVGGIAVFRTFKDSYMAPATNRMGDCIEAAAGDGNLCGGLATGGASTGGASTGAGGNATGGNATGGNATGGNATGGAVAQNGGGGNGAGGPGMTAGELAGSVGQPGHGEPEHTGNPHAGLINNIGAGIGLTMAAEDAAIEALKHANGIEVTGMLDWLYRGARTAEGAIIGVPLDLLANGMPHSTADGASFAVKNGVIGLVAFFGTPLTAAALIGLDKSLGYLSDSVTGGTRYQEDWQDSIAWRMVHGQAGTIGREGVAAEQAREQQMVHEQLDYMRQQRERDAQALREMMPH